MDLTNPTRTTDTAGTLTTSPPSPNPVSTNLGSTSASSYTIAGVNTANTGAAAGSATPAGSGLATYTAAAPDEDSQAGTALSVDDFNKFRIRVVDAINTLDSKIREITVLTDLTC